MVTLEVIQNGRLIEFVGNEAKGRISKRVFQENKARQISRKTNISYPLIHNHTCAYQGVRNVCFLENTRFEICLFALLPTNWCVGDTLNSKNVTYMESTFSSLWLDFSWKTCGVSTSLSNVSAVLTQKIYLKFK